MTVGFGLIGLIFLVTAFIYMFKPKLEYNKAKSALNFAMVIGSAGIATPLDSVHSDSFMVLVLHCFL